MQVEQYFRVRLRCVNCLWRVIVKVMLHNFLGGGLSVEHCLGGEVLSCRS